jgi:limonene-1,2-epoxide hydrolase
MAATVEITKISASPSGRIEISRITAFGTPGPVAFIQIASVKAISTPVVAEAKVEIVGISGYVTEAFDGTTLWRERVDGVWQVPEWTMYVRVAGVWEPDGS